MQRQNFIVNKTAVLFICTLSAFLAPFMSSSINVALPAVSTEFILSAAQVSWTVTIFMLGVAVFLVPFGRLGDIYGRKKIFLSGLWIYMFASLGLSFSQTAWLLIFGRLIQGLGGAMIFGTSMAILTSVFPASERGKVLGINTAAVYLGLSMGPFLGGVLIEHLGWRSLFWCNVPVGLLLIVLVHHFLHLEWSAGVPEPFDYLGAGLYGVMLASILYGLSILPKIMALFWIFGGVLTGILFVRRQLSCPSPVMQLNIFKNNQTFTFSNLAALINYSATAAVGFILSIYLQQVKLFSPQRTGAILMIQPILMTLVSPLAGRISDRVEPRWVASLGMLLTTLGLLLLTAISPDSSLSLIIGALVILGIGFGLFSSPNTNAVLSAIEKKNYGIASAILGTMRSLGQMLSIGITSAVFAIGLGPSIIARIPSVKLIHYSTLLFLFFSILSLFGIYTSLGRGRIHNSGQRTDLDFLKKNIVN